MESIKEKIDDLKIKLSKIPTEKFLTDIHSQLVSFGTINLINFNNKLSGKYGSFSSISTQYKYIIGLLLSTEYNESNNCLRSNYLETIYAYTNEIIYFYIKNYLYEIEKEKNKDEKIRLLAPFFDFSSYYFADLSYRPEQLIELIRKLTANMDELIFKTFKLKLNDFVDFYNYAHRYLETCYEIVKKTSHRFLKTTNDKTWQYRNDFKFEYSSDPTIALLEETAFKYHHCLSVKNIIKTFGKDKGSGLIDLFTIKRGENNLTYLTDTNNFIFKPLVQLDDDRIFVTLLEWLPNAMFYLFQENFKDERKYINNKSKTLEDTTIKLFKEILGKKAQFIRNIYEKPGQNEHDLIIIYKNYLIIAESKSSKKRKPLYNPKKATKRSEDYFHSSRGIGFAYNQILSFIRLISNKESVTMFDKNNKEVVLTDLKEKKIIPVIVTLENFGSLAINPYFHLESEEQPLPWVCCLADLDVISYAFKRFKLSGDDFIKYLMFRTRGQSAIYAFDEIEILTRFFEGEFKNYDWTTRHIIYQRYFSLSDYLYYTKQGLPYPFKAPILLLEKK